MTTPPTSRDGEKTPETRPAPDFSKFNVHDSFCNPITKTTTSSTIWPGASAECGLAPEPWSGTSPTPGNG